MIHISSSSRFPHRLLSDYKWTPDAGATHVRIRVPFLLFYFLYTTIFHVFRTLCDQESKIVVIYHISVVLLINSEIASFVSSNPGTGSSL